MAPPFVYRILVFVIDLSLRPYRVRFAMNLLFAHFTGIPHHVAEAQSVFALWPLALLVLQLVVVVLRQRTRRALQALLQALPVARTVAVALTLLGFTYALVQVAQAAPRTPAPVQLRGAAAQLLGTIETSPVSGVQELRDARRRLLGSYDPKSNQTRDAQRRLVGTGNLLTTLLSR